MFCCHERHVTLFVSEGEFKELEDIHQRRNYIIYYTYKIYVYYFYLYYYILPLSQPPTADMFCQIYLQKLLRFQIRVDHLWCWT